MRQLIAMFCSLLMGCGTLYPIEPAVGPYARMDQPVLPEAALHGPILEKTRVAGWSTFSYRSSAAAIAANQYAVAGAVANSSANATSVAFERYQSADIQEFLRKLLEDTGTVTRIFPEARWEIRGSGGQSSLSCVSCAVYNTLMWGTLLAFAGVPLFGTREATVELRLYRDHEFLKTYSGYGKCGVFGTGYWALWNGYTADGGGNGYAACSSAAAVADAVKKFQDDPPRLD